MQCLENNCSCSEMDRKLALGDKYIVYKVSLISFDATAFAFSITLQCLENSWSLRETDPTLDPEVKCLVYTGYV